MRRERKSLFRLFFLLFPNQRFTIVLFFFRLLGRYALCISHSFGFSFDSCVYNNTSEHFCFFRKNQTNWIEKKTFIRLVYLILMLVFTQPGFPVDFPNGFIAFRLQYFLFVSDSTIDMWRMSIKTNWKVLQPDELSATTTTTNLILSEVQQQTMIWCFFHIQFHTSLNWSTKHSNNLYHCLVK